MKGISGCMTAMVTPFDRKLEVDYEGLRENVKLQIEGGVSGLVPLGTTGESPTINDEERKMIIQNVVSEAAGKVPVIVGTGTNSTEKTVKYTKEAEKLGADAALVVSPYYNKPSQEGLYKHFEAVANATTLPLIIYNIAGRTGINIETSTLERLSRLDNIIGVKESSGSIVQIMEVISQLPEEFVVLSGDDNFTLPLIAMGGRGTISVASNLFPKMVSEMVGSALSGDHGKAKKLHYALLPLFKAIFIETNPVPIKTAMNILGMHAGGVRLPLCELQPQNAERLKSVLSKYG